jgi:DNA-binding CsgD family transcriptional regulator
MTNNVLELRRADGATHPGSLLRDTVIREHYDVADAARVLAREARRLGLRLMTWHNLATMEPMVDDAGDPLNLDVFGWDDEALGPWLDMEKAVRSPLLKACRVASEPLWINRRGVQSRGGNRFLDQIDFTEIEGFAGASAAIVMPVRIPFGHLAAAILTSIDPAKDDLSEEFAAFSRMLALPIHQLVRSYAMMTIDDRYLPTDNLLTRREIECLNWIAQGKTDYEISVILGCSHAGIRYHITRVGAKLGAVNRTQSVFKACQLGYLGAPSQRLIPTAKRRAAELPTSLVC